MFPFFLVVAGALGGAALLRWWLESRFHWERIARVLHRVHVNGIRGKSTVTRIVAGMLREAGMQTVAKSTGSAAAVIGPSGRDHALIRAGAPTILEQVRVARDYITPDTNAVVIECMAIKPAYQQVSERIVRSTIGVLTNVREDHQDLMGETLPEIARSLLSTCPENGILVTAEDNPEIVPIIEWEARRRNTQVVFADPSEVSDAELARFDYVAFKENVAIGLAIAKLIGIPRSVAMDGMVKAAPDPGVLRMRQLEIAGKQVTWANLFAVNDRESMVVAMERLAPYRTPGTSTVGILNNRSDRQRRAIQFADVAVRDLDFDRLVTFGAYEDIVTEKLLANGYPRHRISNLGEQHSPSVQEIIEEIVVRDPADHVLVVGFVNIHTHQAEMMLHYFEHEADTSNWLPPALEQSGAVA
jgi:poly-gamma-glutamate synthase PgsB/CapB